MAEQKALYLTVAKGPFAVDTAPIPKPGPGQALIKIHATALNPVDWKIQAYDFFVKQYPTILGEDLAGTVEELGEGVTNLKLGDRVIAEASMGSLATASFQQYALTNAEVTAKIPDSISFEEGASVPLGLATAAVGLYSRIGGAGLFPPWGEGGHGLYSGKPFVAFGGASSVGQFAIQLAKLSGFSPIITTASTHNTEWLVGIGATHVVDRNLSPEAIRAEVAKITSEPIEVIYDAVSLPDTQNVAYDLLALGGCLIIDLDLSVDKAKQTDDKRVEHVYGNINIPRNKVLAVGLMSKLTTYLAEGAIKPNRVEILPNGLEGIIGGLEKLRQGAYAAMRRSSCPSPSSVAFTFPYTFDYDWNSSSSPSHACTTLLRPASCQNLVSPSLDGLGGVAGAKLHASVVRENDASTGGLAGTFNPKLYFVQNPSRKITDKQDTRSRFLFCESGRGRVVPVNVDAISSLALAQSYPDTDVVIVSNNDLNPSNQNRASALYLRSGFSCLEAYEACAQLQETLLPEPGSIGLSAEDLSDVLTSNRHGASLQASQQIWIAGNTVGSCVVFTPSNRRSQAGLESERLPVLCTNSAPLTRSNVTSYDTTRQIRVSTPSAGVLTGFRDKFSFRFLGVQYAESTAGANRFHPPTAVTISSDTSRSALAYGSVCAQPPDADNGHLLHTDEDCMYLNVFSPIVNSATISDQDTPKLPVMFFIHGGGLNTGDSGPFPYNMTTSGFVGNSVSNIYDGTNVVSYGGVVLVTINYRLTAFGWFNASNAALKDTLLALHWVQDNIEAFGGDPTKVLVFGESAGGIMTRYLLGTNPVYTEGLFSAAVLESDVPIIDIYLSPKLALEPSLELAKYVSCADNSSTTFTNSMASCVQGLPADVIAMASYNLGISWDIAIDGDYILTDIVSSIEDGVYARVPTIWASNKCELCYMLPPTISPNSSASVFPESLSLYFNTTQAERILNATDLYPYETAPSSDGISGAVLTLAQLLTDYVVHCPMAYLSSLETTAPRPSNAYKVLFATGLGSPLTPNPATCPGQVCHGDELYWVFATAETDGLYQPLTESAVLTTREVVSRWTALAWEGTPNYEGAAVEWPLYRDNNEVVIAVGAAESIQPYREAQCDFILSQIGLVFGEE
ncbi:uncharacterized protein FIBRA_02648 [Fibroporia radiculosa]|uniref:Enoyl reductase (ER) domain-containing protein n=1 Tax=Fibroporia radiculosa TaxID=599839 RepID=J4HV94_9APHY|nr:uncharacterized protein FIBRA_02648 [Fibroporia radiculosa]CCM00612.1 predicted protein [Fibroporia radiculosa]